LLPADRLTLAIDIQAKSYQLLRWVADAVTRGFIPTMRAHQYATAGDAALAWIEEHYFNLPLTARPERPFLKEFANFFGTYVTSSFDIVDNPGTRLVSDCGCFCPLCRSIVQAPHLRPKAVTKRDKERAKNLMIYRVKALAKEEGMEANDQIAMEIVESETTRRPAGYSAYGHWLIRRLEGETDGASVLALWREIAWTQEGSPVKKFKLEYKDFVDAEESLVNALQTALLQTMSPRME
jgi:hypothetical protein